MAVSRSASSQAAAAAPAIRIAIPQATTHRARRVPHPSLRCGLTLDDSPELQRRTRAPCGEAAAAGRGPLRKGTEIACVSRFDDNDDGRVAVCHTCRVPHARTLPSDGSQPRLAGVSAAEHKDPRGPEAGGRVLHGAGGRHVPGRPRVGASVAGGRATATPRLREAVSVGIPPLSRQRGRDAGAAAGGAEDHGAPLRAGMAVARRTRFGSWPASKRITASTGGRARAGKASSRTLPATSRIAPPAELQVHGANRSAGRLDRLGRPSPGGPTGRRAG